MTVDIAKVMTYEIRREIAERYFGFRKLIEEDKYELARKIRAQSITIEQRIALDLARIYFILQDRQLIEDFLELTGLDDALFYDEYMISSPSIRPRVFAGITTRSRVKPSVSCSQRTGDTPARSTRMLVAPHSAGWLTRAVRRADAPP